MRTLFFSNPSQEEYENLFLNGSRRRSNRSVKSDECTSVKTRSSTTTGRESDSATIPTVAGMTSSDPLSINTIQVERATQPEDPAIYVIDNFLTDSELDYFDKKISSISFQRSFVDNMECEDDNQNSIESQNPRHGNTLVVNEDQNQNSTSIKRRDSLSVYKEHTSASTQSTEYDNGRGINIGKKSTAKVRKRKRRTIVDDSQRTSTFYSFLKLHDSKISALEQRVANILGCWVHQIEALQLVRYLPGQFFGIHHDLGNLLENDKVELPRKNLVCKRRLITIFCYLNTLKDDEGGCTYFPKCGHLRVRPKRGRAVFWCNITPDGKADPRTIHAGEAVKSNSIKVERRSLSTNFINEKIENKCRVGGTIEKKIEPRSSLKVGTKKYGLNIWICEE